MLNVNNLLTNISKVNKIKKILKATLRKKIQLRENGMVHQL